MTKKRFKHNGSLIFGNGKALNTLEVVDLLNTLNDENEQLKSKNRGLQSELQIFKEDVTHSNLQINKLADENEQLKSRVQYLERKIQRERASAMKQHEKWEEEIQKENQQLKKALMELKEIGDYQEGRIKELNNENEQLKQFQEQVARVIEGKMGDNVCNNYKMEVLKEIWKELELDEVWFE